MRPGQRPPVPRSGDSRVAATQPNQAVSNISNPLAPHKKSSSYLWSLSTTTQLSARSTFSVFVSITYFLPGGGTGFAARKPLRTTCARSVGTVFSSTTYFLTAPSNKSGLTSPSSVARAVGAMVAVLVGVTEPGAEGVSVTGACVAVPGADGALACGSASVMVNFGIAPAFLCFTAGVRVSFFPQPGVSRIAAANTPKLMGRLISERFVVFIIQGSHRGGMVVSTSALFDDTAPDVNASRSLTRKRCRAALI